MLDTQVKEELALKYITNNLDINEKFNVYSLMSKDEEFRQMIVKEKLLLKKMNKFNIKISKEKSDFLLKEILKTTNINNKPNYVYTCIDAILKDILPNIQYKFINYFIKENLIYEH